MKKVQSECENKKQNRQLSRMGKVESRVFHTYAHHCDGIGVHRSNRDQGLCLPR